MAMKPKRRKSKRRALRRTVRGGLSRLRKQIAPPAQAAATDERNGSGSSAGILRPGSGYLRLPDALAEAGETEADDSPVWMPGRIVLTITALAVVFIAIIAWFVSQMPVK